MRVALCVAGMLLSSCAALKLRPAPVPLRDYYEVGSARAAASFSADERLVAYLSSADGKDDAWVQPVEGGPARRLTRANGTLSGFDFSPTSDVFVYSADEAGNGAYHLFATDSAGGAARALVPADGPQTRTDFLQWSADGRRFLSMSNRRAPEFMDLYVHELDGGAMACAWEASGTLSFAGADRELSRFVLADNRSDVDGDLLLVSADGGVPVLLTAHTGNATFWPLEFSPDGRTLYATSDEGGEFPRAVAIDLTTRTRTPVEGLPAGEATALLFSPRGSWRLAVVSAEGAALVTTTTLAGARRLELEGLGAPGTLVPRLFSRSESYLVARVEGERAPRGPWLVDLETRQARPLRQQLPASLAGRELAAARAVRVPSFDGREVPAFVYAPPGRGPFPAVLMVHGGPTSEARREFDPLVQYLVSRGWVVMVPNVRGSTGYGKTWASLDTRDLGGGPLRDVVACKRWLSTHAAVDGRKVAILGESYGGYMALAAATFAPGEFAAHVDLFGISDLKALVESFPPYALALGGLIFEKFGNPADPSDAAYQRERSPLFFADRIVSPLLVVQGANDAQVKKEQSDRIVEAARGHGVPVEYLVIEGEGHGFSQLANQLRVAQAIDTFLERWVVASP